MRHLATVLVLLAGCSDSGSGRTIEITPGPAATVVEGNLLQLAARAPGGDAIELVIDDEVAALFQTHELVNTEQGAILTLVPTCEALGDAPNGTVSMMLRAADSDVEPVTLSIQILSEVGGVCDGAPEHAVTHATLQVAHPADGGNVLCTKTTAVQHSMRDPARRVVQTSSSAPNRVLAGDGHVLCVDDVVLMDVWPPIDAPAIETFIIETFSCTTEGCDASATACCDAQPERLTPLTSTELAVPVRSVSEYIPGVDGDSIACADLDNNGTPELVLAARNVNPTVTSELGADSRFSPHVDTTGGHAKGLLAFEWESGPGTVEPVLLAGFGPDIKRAHVEGDAMVWTVETQFSFATSDNAADDAKPDAVLPVPTTPDGPIQYVARISTTLELRCISPSCTTGTTSTFQFGAGSSWVPLALATADTNGDGSEDVIVAFRPAVPAFGVPNSIKFMSFEMTWGSPPTVNRVDLATFALDMNLKIVSAPSGTACDRLWVLSGESTVHEMSSPACGSTAGWSHFSVPTPNLVYSIATVDQRVIISSALGMFELTYVTDSATDIRQVDPLLQEQLATTGNALIDPSANYGQRFTPCIAANPSIAFQIGRGEFEWAKLDITSESINDQ